MAKLLNQGAYGCVYYPGFTCKGNIEKSKKFVTKIEIFDKTSKNELDISSTVRTIKNYNKFFSPVIKHCISRFKQVNKYRDKLEECEAVNISENIYNDFIIIYISYINGKELEKYLLDIETPSIYISNILRDYMYLLESIKKLQEKNIIHYDLHTGNILYDLDKKIPIIIDFGLSIDTNKFFISGGKIDYEALKKSTMHYSPKHYTYPPELHFITFALEDLDREHIDKSLKQKITPNMVDKFIEDIIDANKIQKRYVYYKNIADTKSKQKSDDYKKELERYYKKFINKSKKDAIDELVGYTKTLDQYTLTIDISIILIKMINKVVVEQESQNTTVKNLLFFILEIMIYNLQVDPEKRMSVEEYREFYNILFKNNTGFSSESVINSIKKHPRLNKQFIELEKYYVKPNIKILDDARVKEFLKIISPTI